MAGRTPRGDVQSSVRAVAGGLRPSSPSGVRRVGRVLRVRGKLAGLRQLIPAFTIGALAAGIVQSFAMALADPFGTAELVTAGDLAVAVAYSAGFGIAVHIMRFVRVLRDGTPACFQGIAITLACIFTGQGPATSDLGQPLRPSLRRRDRVGPVMPAGLGRRLGQRGAERAA